MSFSATSFVQSGYNKTNAFKIRLLNSFGTSVLQYYNELLAFY